MMWLSVLHRYGNGCIFTTIIERQHVARLIESALYIFHSTNWLASVSTQAGMFLHWYTREQFCDVVQEGIIGYAPCKHYSCQKCVKTGGFELKYLFPAQPSPGTMENSIFAY